jgi:hypothetical protein
VNNPEDKYELTFELKPTENSTVLKFSKQIADYLNSIFKKNNKLNFIAEAKLRGGQNFCDFILKRRQH